MKKNISTKEKILIVCSITFLFFAILYSYAAFYFHSHFFFGTKINGMNCERMTVEEVKERMQDNISKYTLTLIERNNEAETITGTQLGMTYVDDNGIESVLNSQKELLWIVSLFDQTDTEVAANMTYDTSIVSTIVDSLNCTQSENMIEPQDADIVFSDGSYTIAPEVVGTSVLIDSLTEEIISAIDNGRSELNLEETGLYKNPSIFSTDESLLQKLEYLNKLGLANITYDMGDNRIYTVNNSVLENWIVRDNDGNYSLDRAQVYAFVKQMAYDTDTFGLAHTFKTHSGRTIQLASGGDYGWVINKDKTTDALIEAIENSTDGTLEPIYQYKAMDRGINDIGGTYVEVCISQQKMWCYKNGQLIVETNVITGNHSTGYDTPSGSVWAIDAKKKDAHFKTFDVDVTFWLPFNDGCGIHDASWRSSEEYVPSTYETNGSHGCVNTPYSAAEKIFNTVGIGYPVIVYYSEDQPVGPQPTQETSVG